MSFNNVIVKNTNLNRELRHNSVLLENIFKSNYKEFSRLWYPMVFNVECTNGASYTQVGSKKDFSFSYLLQSIFLRSTTTNNARVKIRINGKDYPAEQYQVSGAQDFVFDDAIGFSPQYTVGVEHCFNLFIDKPFTLEFFGLCSSATENVLVYFCGWKIPLKEVLLTVKKQGVVRYE